ncbi:hypothetical protein [Photorhabdus viridis]|uniref:hypothetical protein n=1 Tax=Photorhabdus viridis TaxID=3163327 RepID=UPI003307AC86
MLRVFFTSLLILSTLTTASYAVVSGNNDKPINDNLHNMSMEELGYSSFSQLNSEEMHETKGKVGLIVTGTIGAVGGASLSIGLDKSNGDPVNWRNAITAASAGFVTGATGGLMGPSTMGVAASSALGVSAGGATNALLKGMSRGSASSGCSTCHSNIQ